MLIQRAKLELIWNLDPEGEAQTYMELSCTRTAETSWSSLVLTESPPGLLEIQTLRLEGLELVKISTRDFLESPPENLKEACSLDLANWNRDSFGMSPINPEICWGYRLCWVETSGLGI